MSQNVSGKGDLYSKVCSAVLEQDAQMYHVPSKRQQGSSGFHYQQMTIAQIALHCSELKAVKGKTTIKDCMQLQRGGTPGERSPDFSVYNLRRLQSRLPHVYLRLPGAQYD
jgi:hypothetical protein